MKKWKNTGSAQLCASVQCNAFNGGTVQWCKGEIKLKITIGACINVIKKNFIISNNAQIAIHIQQRKNIVQCPSYKFRAGNYKIWKTSRDDSKVINTLKLYSLNSKKWNTKENAMQHWLSSSHGSCAVIKPFIVSASASDQGCQVWSFWGQKNKSGLF